MAYRLIELYAPKDKESSLQKVCERDEVLDSQLLALPDNKLLLRLIARSEQMQTITDELQKIQGNDPKHFTSVVAVETLIPKPKESEEEKVEKAEKKFMGISREELYEEISKGAILDHHFLLLVIFSTLVAAIGLVEDNVAVVIGAMVIAPLLGPNLALAFATALGDIKLIRETLKTNLAGVVTCLLVSVLIGLFWPVQLTSHELFMRTDVGYDSVILAIVSGAAAVLSLTRGVSSTMVGVMVAVALLPPATTLGLFLGSGQLSSAYGAFLLLAVNVVSVNLAAKITFWYRGIRPRTWYEQKRAKETMRWYLIVWGVALGILIALITLKDHFWDIIQ